jgi:hypothetical protein
MENNDNKHRYSPWFMRTDFDNDYGSFTCDKCGCGFYHSPSTITLNGKELYNCCCGNCTNELIFNDWRKTPYE